MSRSSLSEFDRDRVAVTLRRVSAITRELRQEYPEAFEGRSGESTIAETSSATGPRPARTAHSPA